MERVACSRRSPTNPLGANSRPPCFIWLTHCFAHQETSQKTPLKHWELSPAPPSLGKGGALQWSPNSSLTHLPADLCDAGELGTPARPLGGGPGFLHDPPLWRRCLGKPYGLASMQAPRVFPAHPPPRQWLALCPNSYLCECCPVFPRPRAKCLRPSCCQRSPRLGCWHPPHPPRPRSAEQTCTLPSAVAGVPFSEAGCPADLPWAPSAPPEGGFASVVFPPGRQEKYSFCS